jgi:hypothetical protein
MTLVRARIGGAEFLCANCDHHYSIPEALRVLMRDKQPETA